MGLRADHCPVWVRATGRAEGVGGSVLQHRGFKTASPAPTGSLAVGWYETATHKR